MQQSFWEKFLDKNLDLKEKNKVYYSILRSLVPLDLKNDVLTINCVSDGAKKYIDKKRAEIEEMVSIYVGKKISIVFIVQKEEKKTEAPLLSFEPTKEDIYRKAGLNANCTFDNYAVSNTNQIAFAASQAVAQNPGKSYNPLFLYGGVGVGKTHLAQGIARYILDKNTDSKVYFCSGERFMNDLIESIREKATPSFRRKYRPLELIVVDDIQFIAGKQTAQEEFFHTFNSIVSAGGQVVLTSDRPPHEIRNLEDRLRSRFSGGLIVDIQAPDFELRTAILMIKAKEKNIIIDIDIAKTIADTVFDTRSLEGTLLSLYARSMDKKGQIDLDMVEDFFKSGKEKTKKKISPADIIKIVCTFYNVRQSHLKSSTRVSRVAQARQIVMYLLRTELELNLEEVAYITKRKDHTTVLHAVNKIKNMTMRDNSFKNEIDTIIQTLQSST